MSTRQPDPHRAPPVALIILDGWGLAEDHATDATWLARTPVMHRIVAGYPHAQLEASGEAVGLPAGVIGNSEVGHLNLGAGRVVYQDLTRISLAIRDRSLFANRVLCDEMDAVRARGGKLHLVGLLSEAGVHAHTEHVAALVELARERGLERVYVHPFTDGRDSDPRAGRGLLAALIERMRALGVGQVGSVCGRALAMDRDKRWDRTERAYRALVLGEAPLCDDPLAALEASYARGVTDEFVEPCCVRGPRGRALAPVEAGDTVMHMNFRADRARQLCRALVEPGFADFARPDTAPRPRLVTLTRYADDLDAAVAFEPTSLDGLLGAEVARAGRTQLRLAESEKYAHVTYFFNGGEEAPFPGEDRVLVPSDRTVATYDLAPAMRAREVAEVAIARLRDGPVPDLLVLNFANPDMVGHTGNLAAAIAAIEVVDECLGRVLEALAARGGVALVTADHGNAEQMVDPVTGQPHTAHTTNPVPIVLVGEGYEQRTLRSGKLGDVAPTLLALLGLPAPAAMTGRSLIDPEGA